MSDRPESRQPANDVPAGPGHDPEREVREPVIRRLFAVFGRAPVRWAIVVVWVALIALTTPLAARLTDVQENGSLAFLPDSADSARVAELQDRFQDDDTLTAVLVYTREGGLTPDDLAAIEDQRQQIAQRLPADPVGPVVPSDDGLTALVTVTIPDAENRIEDDVPLLRDIVGTAPDGLGTYVSGAAGFDQDLSEVFGGINGRLLGSAAVVVAIILLITYRSPFLWLIPLITVALADRLATAGAYGLVELLGVQADGQSTGILPVLVFGAGTDYALLLISRYREELRRHERPAVAMAVALRRAGPAILASAATVTIGLLCLLAADLNSNRSLGPIGAAGIVAAVLAMLTLLPAILILVGRRVFWPFVPRFGAVVDDSRTVWSRVGRLVSRGPRVVWIGMIVLLVVLGLGVTQIDTNLSQADQFTTQPDSIVGQTVLARSFPAGASAPTTVIANESAADATLAAIRSVPTVADVQEVGRVDGLVSFAVTLTTQPATTASSNAVQELRDTLGAVPGAGALVGGADAENYDVQRADSRDRAVVVPLILLVVFTVLCLLLRSILAPVLLIATVVLSYIAALGVSVLVFEYVFGFAAVGSSVPLLGFVFLVALGVDYNIFLMGRVHEESATLGTRRGMLHGLGVTGGVITSAGVVLAATFAVLGLLPLVVLAEVGFLVAFGVLLDTLLVRSVLVPALALDIGPRIWWPSALGRRAE